MSYQRQLKKVIDYIGEHLDEELSLEKLSEISCFSKFHFHRLFTALTGMSLQQYIRWLRLSRAAHQLIVDKEEPIINIAFNAGFESHEAFSRAFKQCSGVSPSQHRQGQNCSYWDSPPYCLPKQGEGNMNVTKKSEPKVRLAVIEHKGDLNGLINSVDKLISWVKEQATTLKLKPGETFGIAYDDPKTTPADEFRFDIGIKVPENLTLKGEVVEKYLPAGRYATAIHKGSHDNIAETVYQLYREWLPSSGEALGDFPCVFCYQNFRHEVAETELLTECRLLLKG